MSKIWILLLLVGAIQFVRSYPALEEEYELDTSGEERGFAEWWKHQWGKTKNAFKKVGKKIKDTFNKGREFLKKKAIKVDPLNCEGGKQCKSCVAFLEKKQKFCIQFDFDKKDGVNQMTVTITKEKEDKGVKEIFPATVVSMGKASTCMKLGKFLGKLCLQGVEGRAKSSNGKPDINFCLGAVLKNFGVGCKFCASYQEGKLKMRLKPKMFAGDDDEGAVLEAHETIEDEGKMVDAEDE